MRIRKGSREYWIRSSAARPSKGQSSGRKLGVREAASFVRSLHSRDEQALLRRLTRSGAGLHHRSQDLIGPVITLLEGGRLEVWVVESQRVTGPRHEREEYDAIPPIEPPDTHTVVIELVDVDENPVPFEPYRIKLPDGRIETRTLDQHGRDRISGIRESGNCLVCFHRRDAATWSRP